MPIFIRCDLPKQTDQFNLKTVARKGTGSVQAFEMDCNNPPRHGACPLSRGPLPTTLARRESGTGTNTAIMLFCKGSSISLNRSQSHFPDSRISLTNQA